MTEREKQEHIMREISFEAENIDLKKRIKLLEVTGRAMLLHVLRGDLEDYYYHNEIAVFGDPRWEANVTNASKIVEEKKS